MLRQNLKKAIRTAKVLAKYVVLIVIGRGLWGGGAAHYFYKYHGGASLSVRGLSMCCVRRQILHGR